MSEVIYSINGIPFSSYNVFVSESGGLMDALKRKPVKTYDWHEYHGQSIDLSNPKFEAREITLSCFVVGENFEDMFFNFKSLIISEFQKPKTQRLMVEPFGYNPLIYQVYMVDGVELQKTFRDGQMVGIFQLKLIEPNPIKKVLRLLDDTLELSYDSSKETEIFYGNGTSETVKGNASISKHFNLGNGSYVVIAGDIDEIYNFNTNAEVIWEKL